jgi:hypothetical protein
MPLLRRLVLIVFGLVVLSNGIWIWRQPVWSPRDELAHFDYVERLSDGELPQANAPIAKQSFRITRDYLGAYQYADFDGTPQGLGLAGISYEAGQPPLYYVLLAGPNRLLRTTALRPPDQIRLLRILQYGFVVLGAILALPLSREAARTFGGDESWGAPFAIALALPHLVYTHSLGNDNASLAAGMAVLLLWCRALHKGNDFAARGASLVFGLSLLLKYSNLVLLPAHVVAAVVYLSRHGRRRDWCLLPALSALPLIGWLAANVYRLGEPLGTRASLILFSGWVGPMPIPLFLDQLARDAFNMGSANLALPSGAGWILLGVLATHAAFRFARWRRGHRPADAAVAVVAASALAAVGFGAVLNAFRPGVHWVAFRHYVAIFPLWLIGLFGWPPVTRQAWRAPLRMIRTLLPAVLALFVVIQTGRLAWTSLRRSDGFVRIVPAVSRSEGRGGVLFVSDLIVESPADRPLDLTLSFRPHDADGRTGPSLRVTIEARRRVEGRDLLHLAFGIEQGFGALSLSASPAPVELESRIRMVSGESAIVRDVPVMRSADWVRLGNPRTIEGVAENGFFRTNLAVASAVPFETPLDVTLFCGEAVLGRRRFFLPPEGMVQMNRVVRQVGVDADVEGLRLLLSTREPGAAFAAAAFRIANEEQGLDVLPAMALR